MSRVVFTEPAEYDVLEITRYIRQQLKNKSAAIHIRKGIMSTAKKLGTFPKKHPCVKDVFLVNFEFRMTWFDNYNIFYRYEEKDDIVYILRVLYSRADWQNILE